MGLVWSVPVPSKENDRASTKGKGGGNRIIGGGVVFWGGVLWYAFTFPEFSTPFVCFSEFSTPLCFP